MYAVDIIVHILKCVS